MILDDVNYLLNENALKDSFTRWLGNRTLKRANSIVGKSAEDVGKERIAKWGKIMKYGVLPAAGITAVGVLGKQYRDYDSAATARAKRLHLNER